MSDYFFFNTLFPKVSSRARALCGGCGLVGCGCVLCCQRSCCPEVPVRDMWPSYTAWVNCWVEMEDVSRNVKLKLSCLSFCRYSPKLQCITVVQSPQCMVPGLVRITAFVVAWLSSSPKSPLPGVAGTSCHPISWLGREAPFPVSLR